ncbi:MAG TPA: DUF3617 family protein [Allosphingosinicella sp.]|nr:DUF3617 family protein [Allosphingosinicella sp.]
MLRPVIMIAALAATSCSGRNEANNATVNAEPDVIFQPGFWEMRPTITLSERIDREMPRNVVIMWCMSDGLRPNIPNANETFFGPATVHSQCTDDLTFPGGRVEGTRECFATDEGRYWNNVTGRFTPTSFEIEEIVQSQSAEGTREVARIRSRGRRTGECPRSPLVGDPGQTNAAANAATPAR